MEIEREAAARNIFVVSGEFGSGKSAFCQQTVVRLGSAGIHTAGLLSPGRYIDGKKTGFWCENIASGERRLMASSLPDEIRGERFGMWTFDPAVVAWGNQVLAEITQTDVLIIDEIGPLEFNLKSGWIQAIDTLKLAEYSRALVVIRPTCLPDFSQLGFHYGLLDWQLDTAREGWFRTL